MNLYSKSLLFIVAFPLISGFGRNPPKTSIEQEVVTESAMLAVDLQKAPPKWKSTGDEDLDAFGTKLFKLVDGSSFRMNQFYQNYTNQKVFTKFLMNLELKSAENASMTADKLLSQMRHAGKGVQADKVVDGAHAVNGELNELDNFLDDIIELPDIVGIAIKVRFFKKVGSAQLMMKIKIARDVISL